MAQYILEKIPPPARNYATSEPADPLQLHRLPAIQPQALAAGRSDSSSKPDILATGESGIMQKIIKCRYATTSVNQKFL